MYKLEELANLKNIEPLRKSGWRLVGDSFPSVDGGSELPAYFMQSADIPSPKFNPVPIFGGGTNKYYAGNQDIDQVTITFFENYRTEVIEYLDTWINFIRDENGIYSLPSEYKKRLSFKLLDITGKTASKIVLTGCWPTGGYQLALDHASNDILTIPVTLSVDSYFLAI